MKLLAIETSCDETAVAILEATGSEHGASFTILGNALLSQIELHRQYGGVFPALAKREHAKNLVPLLQAALEEAELLREDEQTLPDEQRATLAELLAREPELLEQLIDALTHMERPAVDAIAVTAGPGLEPALWVGVNLARALALVWNLPIVAVNHMEGHLLSALAESTDEKTLTIPAIALPLLGLLISGGHTELVVMKEWGTYEKIGQTKDDAVGEAFDKVARMLGLPYPGGPEVSRLAEKDREDARTNPYQLPRPMIASGDLDFSFSGLKTAVLYKTKEAGEDGLSEERKEQLARAFEDAATDVLYKKSSDALAATAARTLALGGGVSANTHIRRMFRAKLASEHPQVKLSIPSAALTSDNAIMIGIAGYFHALTSDFTDSATLRADGNLSLA